LMKREVYRDIAALRDQIDCRPCPSTRHCCSNFSRDFSLYFTTDQAEEIFGKKLEGMLYEKRLICSGDGFELVKGDCPMLTQDNACRIHSRKSDLGLYCLDYPIYPLSEYNSGDEHIKGPLIFIDFRCHFMEKHWSGLKGDIKAISLRHDIAPYVLFREKPGSSGCTIEPLTSFSRREEIPEQRL
jgi:hypothetical protein